MSTPVARRPLTDAELADIFAEIDAATNPVATIARTICAVYLALLNGVDRPDLGFGPGQHIDPTEFFIPDTQWRAIVAVATNRANEWGTAADLRLDVVNLMPSTYDDPTVAAPMPNLPDRRPAVHQVDLSRDAVDVIAANTGYLDQLAAAHGPDSPIVADAAASWHRALTGLLVINAGGHTTVRADGHRSLLVTTASGFRYGIVFHPYPASASAPPVATDGPPAATAPTTPTIRSFSPPM